MTDERLRELIQLAERIERIKKNIKGMDEMIRYAECWPEDEVVNNFSVSRWMITVSCKRLKEFVEAERIHAMRELDKAEKEFEEA